jgi:hypothetical protein
LAAERGTFTPVMARLYVENIRVLLEHTPIHLGLAIEQSERRGYPALARYYRQKLDEEAGHDQWARNDARALEQRFGMARDQPITSAMRQNLAYQRGVICDDPKLYLAYILFAEYFTVLVSGDWLELLENRCGIPAEFLSAEGNHVELDKHHVAEELAELAALIDPSDVGRLLEVIDRSNEHWLALSAELCECEPALGDPRQVIAEPGERSSEREAPP